jgi:hypothetical protein
MHGKMVFVLAGCLTLLSAASPPFAQRVDIPPDEQRAFEEKYDKLGILQEARMKRDTSPSFITVPADWSGERDFDVAQTPPAIDFAVIQGYEPWYIPSLEYSKRGGSYSGWGDVTVGPDGCFYFSIGNHRAWGGNAYIVRYDPEKKTQRIEIDLKKLVGWTEDEFGEGKIHGEPEVSPRGDMWLLTFFGPFPSPEDYDKGIYRGGRLIHHNVFSGKTEDLGIPLEGASWPYQCYDWDRGVLFGVSQVGGTVIAFDTIARRMIFGGCPPDSIAWYMRCVLLDRDTGYIYTTDSPLDAKTGRPLRNEHPLLRWERRNNTFTFLQAKTPVNPASGKSGPLRAHTNRKDASGAFRCLDSWGSIFLFHPQEDRTEFAGATWGKEGRYTTAVCMSPRERYLYYIPGADGSCYRDGVPVVQYDMKTNRRKVLAFLRDFYLEKYGYNPILTYGLEMDKRGESLCFYISGRFSPRDSKIAVPRPAVFHLHIPASERRE